jgi:uncharacterized coiled-coil protein SlyX
LTFRYTRAELKAQIAALEAEVARLNSIILQQDQALLEKNAELEGLYQQLADKQATINSLNSSLADRDAEIDALEAEVASLETELEACKNPPVTDPPSTFGSSTGRHNYDYFTQMAGAPLKVRRSYDVWPAVHPREDAGRNASVWSFKPPITQFVAGQLDAEFIAALKSVPDDGYGRYVIVYHEPEDNIEAGDFTSAQYRDMQKRARVLIDQVNATRKTKIRFGGNLMAWSFQTASRRNPANYFPGPGVWDFLALDGYSGTDGQGNWTGGRTPAAIFGTALKFCQDNGVRFAVAETGIDVKAPEPDRVAWIKACRDYAKNANCEFWCYWDGSFSTFWLNTQAEFKAVVLGS